MFPESYLNLRVEWPHLHAVQDRPYRISWSLVENIDLLIK